MRVRATLFGIGLAVLLVAAAAAVYFHRPVNTALPLTGGTHHKGKRTVQPPTGAAHRTSAAYAVIIENSPAARPQSGLDAARLVFEAPAEGGITRFLAVFWGQSVPQIGPVRSTRIYFDQLAKGYDLPLFHAGGNVDALAALHSLHIENLDDIGAAGPWFWRASGRVAPHNLYTSSRLAFSALHQLGLVAGSPPESSASSLPRGLATSRLAITYANDPGVFVERPTWTYQHGTYVRSEDATPDLALDGRPIRAQSVIVLITPESPDPDPYTAGALRLALTGSGAGWLVSHGERWAITWHRTPFGPFTFTQKGAGQVSLPLTPTWIELVPWGSAVQFSR